MYSPHAQNSKRISIYSFSGENDYITINNGVLIITPDLEKFIGGDLTFKNELFSVQYMAERFYYFKDGEEIIIRENINSIKSSDEGMNIVKKDTGFNSSNKLFYGNDLDQIRQSLNFFVYGKFINGETFE